MSENKDQSKCGDFGGVNAKGEPCTKPAPDGEGRCRFHEDQANLKKKRNLEKVEELAAEGCKQEVIADVFDMSGRTLREFKQNNPEVREAYERGLRKHEQRLLEKINQIAENDPGDVPYKDQLRALIYELKAIHGRYDKPTSGENVQKTAVQVNITQEDIKNAGADELTEYETVASESLDESKGEIDELD